MGRPTSPFESTSSSMRRSQSAITWGRVPGLVRMSLSVLMGGDFTTVVGRPRPPLRGTHVLMDAIKRPGTALGVVTGINVLNYLDRYMVAAVLPLITPAFHLSGKQGGLLLSMFMIVYLLVSPVMGWLGDSRPRLRLAAAGVTLWSLATLGS